MVHWVSPKISYKRNKCFIVSYRSISDNCENLKCNNGEQNRISSHSLFSKNAFSKCSIVLCRVWSTVVLCHHCSTLDLTLCIPVERVEHRRYIRTNNKIKMGKSLNGSSWMRSVFQISENTLVVLVQSSYFDINIVWHSLTQFQKGFFITKVKVSVLSSVVPYIVIK